MPNKQYARGTIAGFSDAENPFRVPGGMEDNLRLTDDLLGLYTVLPPVVPGTPRPVSPADGQGQIYSDGSFDVFNAGSWKKYPARQGVKAVQLDGHDVWLSSGQGWVSMRLNADLDVAHAAASIYLNTATGIAATTNGQYFSIPSPLDSEFLILYRNNAGAAVEVKRYPSSVAIEGLSEATAAVAAGAAAAVAATGDAEDFADAAAAAALAAQAALDAIPDASVQQVAAAASAAAAAASETAAANSAATIAGDAAAAHNAAIDAVNAKLAALNAAAATGPFRIYATYAAAVADLAAVPANGFVEVQADESRADSPRVRYQKVAGVYVFVIDLDRYQTQLLTLPQQYKVAEFLDKVKTQPCRIVTQGTSIAIGDMSAVQNIPEQIANVYGRNSSSILNMGVYGGNYQAVDGHKKQIYGGSHFVRLVLAAGENDINFGALDVDKIVVVYGKEATGGTFDVWIDGVYDATVSCNGAQAYNQEYVKTFATRGLHRVSLKANTGKAFIERMEWLTAEPGVYVENGTIGGFGMRHSITLPPDPVGNEPGIAIVGTNGVDAIFNRGGVTKASLFIVQQQTNDGALGITDFTTAIRRMVACTKASSTPVVLCTEAICSGYLNADGTIRPNSTGGIRETVAEIVSHGKEKHIALLDWSKMLDHSNFAAYDAKYFPTVDKTHPTEQAYLPLNNAMAALFNVPHPGLRYKYDTICLPVEQAQTQPSIQQPATVDPYNFALANAGVVKAKPQDVFHDRTLTVIGEAYTLVNRRCSLMQARDVPNLVPQSYLDAIAASATSDEYGKFIRLGSNENFGLFGAFAATSIDQVFTVVLQLKPATPRAGINFVLRNGANNKNARVYVGDEPVATPGGNISVNQIRPQLSQTKPTFLAFQCRLDATDSVGGFLSLIGSTADIYGVWVTEGKQAVVTPRNISTYKGVGLPVFMTGDYTPDQVTVGQVYQEIVNGTLVEKLALPGYCYKPLTQTFHRVYELRNKGAIRFGRLPVLGPGALAAYAKAGGELYASSGGLGGGPAFGAAGILGGSFPFGKRFTLAYRSNNGSNTVKIGLYNGGSDTWTGLQANGTWVTQALGAIPGIGGGAVGADNVTNAISFDLPDASFTAAVGVDPMFYAGWVGGANSYGPGALCEGNSAIISAP